LGRGSLPVGTSAQLAADWRPSPGSCGRAGARCASQTVAPNKAPTPAVSAIASAPQKVTRATDLHTGEPPARAAKAPNSARKNNELPDPAQTRADAGTNRTSTSGRAAPTAKVLAEARAA